jgi:hypothetical protein
MLYSLHLHAQTVVASTLGFCEALIVCLLIWFSVKMHISNLIALFVSAKTAFAACSGPLVIDEFSRWSSNSNSLNSWVSGMFWTLPRDIEAC